MEERKTELRAKIASSSNSEDLLELGQLELDSGEFQEALFHLLGSVSADPQNHLARLRLAQAFIELKFTSFAVRELEQLLKVFPQNTFIRKILSQIEPESATLTSHAADSATIKREQVVPEQTVAEAEFDFEALEVLGGKKPS